MKRSSRGWLALSLLLVACEVPVAAGLPEADANEVLVALEENGVAAAKESDPTSEGRFRVTVTRDDASAAVGVLARKNLPRPSGPSVLDALGKGSLVPSRSSEHARLIAGTAGELERSLGAVGGVLGVRVHLAVPFKDQLAIGEAPQAPSASVLIRHVGATAPIAVKDVQRLVAGAVPGLSAEQVAVVTTATPNEARPIDRELARFGPITLTRSSMRPLRWVAVGIALVNLLLLSAVLGLWMRLRGREAELREFEAQRDAARAA